ncbi:MAG: hypothetical protein ABIO16_00925 [Nocardioides sp.]
MTTTSSTETYAGVGDDSGSATERAQQTAGTAKDEAQRVAQEAKSQARQLMDEARGQVDEQSRTQRDRLVSTLGTFGDDLERMAENQSGMAADATREIASRVRGVSQHLDGREPGELIEDLRSFARRRPGLFLAGSLAAGLVAGRLIRGTREAVSAGSDDDNPRHLAQPTATPGFDPTGTTGTTGASELDGTRGAGGYVPPVDPESGEWTGDRA